MEGIRHTPMRIQTRPTLGSVQNKPNDFGLEGRLGPVHLAIKKHRSHFANSCCIREQRVSRSYRTLRQSKSRPFFRWSTLFAL